AIDIYDSVTRTWRTAQLSIARQAPAVTARGSRVVFNGSTLAALAEGVAAGAADIYDVAAGVWTSVKRPGPRTATSTALTPTRALFISTSRPAAPTGTVDIY